MIDSDDGRYTNRNRIYDSFKRLLLLCKEGVGIMANSIFNDALEGIKIGFEHFFRWACNTKIPIVISYVLA